MQEAGADMARQQDADQNDFGNDVYEAVMDNGMVGRSTLQNAIARIQELEGKQKMLKQENDSELNKLRSWYRHLEVKWQEEKERADREIGNSKQVMVEKQHLQEQINELQSAAGNMASTAESVHKWLEERTRSARKEWQQEKSRADANAANVDSLTQEKQELVQQLNELHAAADNMVTTAAESVHQLVEERTRETLAEALQEKARADAERSRVENLEQERQLLLEQLIAVEQAQAQDAASDDTAKLQSTPRLVERGKFSEKGEEAIYTSPASIANGLPDAASLVAGNSALAQRQSSSSTKAPGSLRVPIGTVIPSIPSFPHISAVPDGVPLAASAAQPAQVLTQPSSQAVISGSTSYSGGGPPMWAYSGGSGQVPVLPAKGQPWVSNSSRTSLASPRQQPDAPRAAMNPVMSSMNGVMQSAAPNGIVGYFNSSVQRQPSPVTVKHETTPNAVRRELPLSNYLHRETTPVLNRRDMPVLSSPKLLETPARERSPLGNGVLRQGSPVFRQCSPAMMQAIVRESSPRPSAMRCESEPSKYRMSSMETPMERVVSTRRRQTSSERMSDRGVEQRVSVRTMESIAAAAAENQSRPLGNSRPVKTTYQYVETAAATRAPTLSSSRPLMSTVSTASMAGSISGSMTSLPGLPPGVPSSNAPSIVPPALRAVSPRPITPRSTSPGSVYRSVSQAVVSARSGNLLSFGRSDSRGSSIIRSSSNPVQSLRSNAGEYERMMAQQVSRPGTPDSTLMAPFFKQHVEGSSLAAPIKGRTARQSSQLPRLTSGVPWQPSEENVVIATLEGEAREASPMSRSEKSNNTDHSGVTCIDTMPDVFETSFAPCSPRLVVPAQRLQVQRNLDVRTSPQRTSVSSPNRQTISERLAVLAPKVVPLMTRLPSGGKAPVVPTQEFICSGDSNSTGQNFLTGQPPPMSIWAGMTGSHRGGSSTLPSKLVQTPTTPVARCPLGERASSPVKVNDLKSASCSLPVGLGGRPSYLGALETVLPSAATTVVSSAPTLIAGPMPTRDTSRKPVRVIPAANTSFSGAAANTGFSGAAVRQDSAQRRMISAVNEHALGRTMLQSPRQEYTPRQEYAPQEYRAQEYTPVSECRRSVVPNIGGTPNLPVRMGLATPR
jgi:hypothetical protein